ncbi:MAG: hypothetical protein ABIK62_03405 [candidate division WOR-3 bacterium]
MTRLHQPLLALLGLVGCSLLLTCKRINTADDRAAIADLLSTSEYTNEEQCGAIDDETNDPGGNDLGQAYLPTETIPWVRFVRLLSRPIARSVTITIPAYEGYPETTALATVTANMNGNMYVRNGSPVHHLWVKPISDQGFRRIYLTKHNDTWRIRRMTPWRVTTRDAPYTVAIESVVYSATPSNLRYVYSNPDSLFTKDELPAFVLDDTVTVWVTIRCDSSGWAFLHRGRRGSHIRQAFGRESTNCFVRRWVVNRDSIPVVPTIRATAVDVISWPALFGDSSSPYNACAWTLPLIFLDRPDAERP